jgi:hypothetical protein
MVLYFFSPNFMAATIKVLDSLGATFTNSFITTLKVKAGAAASIKPGYLVIVDGGNAGYVKAAADACDSDAKILGVANSESTDTVVADGVVTIDAAPVLLVAIKAKTPANLTAAMTFTNKYILDVTSGAYTLDQGTTTKGIFTLVSFDNVTDGNCIATLATNW